jgi:hypothetical protein
MSVPAAPAPETVVLAFAGLGIMLGSSLEDLEEKLPRYREALNRVIDKSTVAIPGLGDKEIGNSLQPGLCKAHDLIQRLRRVPLPPLSDLGKCWH